MKKYLILIILTYLFFVGFGFELVMSQNKILFEQNSKTLQITKIYFKDSTTSHIDTFDIIKENPYNVLSYSKVSTNNLGNYVYKLTKTDVESLLTKENTDAYSKSKQHPELSKTAYIGTSSFSVFKKAKNFVSIGYTFYAVDSSGIYLCALSNIFVLDANGRITYKNNHINVNVDQTVITENGKYVAFNYGVQDDNETFINDGFRIYRVADNHLILEKQIRNIEYPSVRKNVIIFGSSCPSEDSKIAFYVFDTDTGMFYSRFFTKDELSELKETTDKGFKFSKKGVLRIDYFENDFKKELIK